MLKTGRHYKTKAFICQGEEGEEGLGETPASSGSRSGSTNQPAETESGFDYDTDPESDSDFLKNAFHYRNRLFRNVHMQGVRHHEE